MRKAVAIIILSLVEGFLILKIIETLAIIASDSTGKSVLLIGLYVTGAVGAFFLFRKLTKDI